MLYNCWKVKELESKLREREQSESTTCKEVFLAKPFIILLEIMIGWCVVVTVCFTISATYYILMVIISSMIEDSWELTAINLCKSRSGILKTNWKHKWKSLYLILLPFNIRLSGVSRFNLLILIENKISEQQLRFFSVLGWRAWKETERAGTKYRLHSTSSEGQLTSLPSNIIWSFRRTS